MRLWKGCLTVLTLASVIGMAYLIYENDVINNTYAWEHSYTYNEIKNTVKDFKIDALPTDFNVTCLFEYFIRDVSDVKCFDLDNASTIWVYDTAIKEHIKYLSQPCSKLKDMIMKILFITVEKLASFTHQDTTCCQKQNEIIDSKYLDHSKAQNESEPKFEKNSDQTITPLLSPGRNSKEKGLKPSDLKISPKSQTEEEIEKSKIAPNFHPGNSEIELSDLNAPSGPSVSESYSKIKDSQEAFTEFHIIEHEGEMLSPSIEGEIFAHSPKEDIHYSEEMKHDQFPKDAGIMSSDSSTEETVNRQNCDPSVEDKTLTLRSKREIHNTQENKPQHFSKYKEVIAHDSLSEKEINILKSVSESATDWSIEDYTSTKNDISDRQEIKQEHSSDDSDEILSDSFNEVNEPNSVFKYLTDQELPDGNNPNVQHSFSNHRRDLEHSFVNELPGQQKLNRMQNYQNPRTEICSDDPLSAEGSCISIEKSSPFSEKSLHSKKAMATSRKGNDFGRLLKTKKQTEPKGYFPLFIFNELYEWIGGKLSQPHIDYDSKKLRRDVLKK